jgi:hypothetical protein
MPAAVRWSWGDRNDHTRIAERDSGEWKDRPRGLPLKRTATVYASTWTASHHDGHFVVD